MVQEVTRFLDSDVNHWLETSRADQYVIQGPALTPKNPIISKQGLPLGDLLSATYCFILYTVAVTTVTLLQGEWI